MAKGFEFHADLNAGMSEDIQEWAKRVLIATAERTMADMTRDLDKAGRVDSGALRASIGYESSFGPSNYNGDPQWRVSVPRGNLSIIVGTACPYAEHIEHNMAGFDGNSSQNPGGGDRIKDWAIRHGFDDHDAEWLVNKIMKEGVHATEVKFRASPAQLSRNVLLARRYEPFKVRHKVRTSQISIGVNL